MLAQRQALQRRITTTPNEDIRRDLEGWLAICNQPLQLDGIDPELKSMCYAVGDRRLWQVPFPHIPCVAALN